MLFRTESLLPLVAILTSGAMAATQPIQLPSFHLPVAKVASLPDQPTFLENIARRPNGDFVITQHEYQATVHLLKNATSDDAELISLHTFSEDEASGLIGITNLDYDRDTFIFTSQRFKGFLDPVPNTTEIWEMKFADRKSDEFSLRKVTNVPTAGLLNGMAQVPSGCSNKSNSLIIADSLNGQLVHLDIATGHYSVVLDVPELHAPDGSAFPTGANGLKIHEGYVYWSNTVTATFYRVLLSSILLSSTSSTSPQIEELIKIPSLAAVDDFSFDGRGNIWGLASVGNTVYVAYRSEGAKYEEFRFVAGDLNSTAIPGPTANIWGREEDGDAHILYVTTTGASKAPINDTVVIPAGIVGVDTRGFF